MAGYGGADDHLGAQEAHIEDSMALHALKQEKQFNLTGICIDCDEPIDKGRLLVMPHCNRCAECQSFRESQGSKFNKFGVRQGYMP